MLPFAPGRLSITTVRPSASVSRGATRRAIVSAGPPGGTATIMRMGLVGYGASAANAMVLANAKPNKNTLTRLLLNLHLRDLDHPCPFRELVLQLRREFRGRVAFGLEAERDELLLHVGLPHDGRDLLVQPAHQRGRRAHRQQQAVGRRDVVAFDRLADRR